MRGPLLVVPERNLRLLPPDVERDAPLSVVWLNGPSGRETMRLMGNDPGHITDTTLEAQRRLVAEFATQPGHINWMIESQGQVVGSIWIDTQASRWIGAPALSFMIGDPMARGQGIAKAVAQPVIEWARGHLPGALVARALTENILSQHIIASLDGMPDGEAYQDDHGLAWQNYRWLAESA